MQKSSAIVYLSVNLIPYLTYFEELNMVGVAVVGLGNIGKVHAKLIKELEVESNGKIRLVAVVDQVRSLAESVASQYSVRSYTTLDDAVKDPDIDVLTIATPTYLHGPQALYAIEYNKNVIVEKPMAVSLVEAREMIAKARKKGVRLGVIFQERYADDIRKLKDIIASGKLGKVFLIESEMKWWRDERNYYQKDELARSWRGMWGTEGGGAMTNQGIHTVDLMIWLGGDVDEVAGFIDNLTHPSITVEDTAVAVIRYKSKALGVISQTVSTRPDNAQYRKIRVFGTEGMAEIHDTTLSLLKTNSESLESEIRAKSTETLHREENLHKKLFRDFLNRLLNGEEFPITGEEGIKSLELIKAIYYSSSTRQFVKLPFNINVVL
ncbi:MAG: Gfo/Idh/MocA family oxidoreductase [Sulfolobaceae archaeon]|nr:Gfo/Idh/MocA family oxidoreductase [Sulfolobaceae archaeon]